MLFFIPRDLYKWFIYIYSFQRASAVQGFSTSVIYRIKKQLREASRGFNEYFSLNTFTTATSFIMAEIWKQNQRQNEAIINFSDEQYPGGEYIQGGHIFNTFYTLAEWKFKSFYTYSSSLSFKKWIIKERWKVLNFPVR